MAKIASLNDTIAAIATPAGQGALGIIRLSGPRALEIADLVFCGRNPKPLSGMKSFCLRYGWIVRDKEAFGKSGSDPRAVGACVVDEVVISLMRAPKSYTKEDNVEISAHGGSRVLCAILELLVEKGARPAEPGEFTKRAFLNGRLDLTQAEAVLDVIQANSDLALRNSLGQLAGGLSGIFKGLRAGLLEILADMEARLDFSEEEVLRAEDVRDAEKLEGVCSQTQSLLEGSFRGRLLREGLKVVIYGRPNTGKSSLLNALLKTERAIVTPIAGTTRDTIEECLNIQGLAVCLIDTAGILDAGDEIERRAVERANAAVEGSDLVLFVVDASAPLEDLDVELYSRVKARKKLIGVVNKCDLPGVPGAERFREFFGAHPVTEVSALKMRNIVALEEEIVKAVFDGPLELGESPLVSNVRHIAILKDVSQALKDAVETLRKGTPLEFAAVDVRRALNGLGELTGEVFHEELLDSIFSRFCIGK
ncbi:MAG: tRNA uridine-5-carboxymethylaminomethyl(34) synthesis GTPase MnmE [Candidatus Omnitrophota bacterium]